MEESIRRARLCANAHDFRRARPQAIARTAPPRDTQIRTRDIRGSDIDVGSEKRVSPAREVAASLTTHASDKSARADHHSHRSWPRRSDKLPDTARSERKRECFSSSRARIEFSDELTDMSCKMNPFCYHSSAWIIARSSRSSRANAAANPRFAERE